MSGKAVLDELIACQSRDYIRWLDPEEREAAREKHTVREREAWLAARRAQREG